MRRLIGFLILIPWRIAQGIWWLSSRIYDVLGVNTGLRILRGWVFGLFLTLLAFIVVFWYYPDFTFNESRISLMAQFTALFLLYLFVVIPLKKIIRKRLAFGSVIFRILGIFNLVAIGFTFVEMFPPPVTLELDIFFIEWLTVVRDVYHASIEPTLPIIPLAWVFGIGIILTYGLPLLSFLLEIVREHIKYREWFVKGAASRFAGVGTYLRFASRLKWGKRTRGILLGRTRFEDYGFERNIIDKSDSMMVTFGCPGAGKAIVSANPVIATYLGNILTIDPKAEYANALTRRRRELGHDVHVLDPFNNAKGTAAMSARARYNPLSELI